MLPQRLADGASALDGVIFVVLAMPAQLCDAPSRDQRQKSRLVSVQKRDKATGRFGETTRQQKPVAQKRKQQNKQDVRVPCDC